MTQEQTRPEELVAPLVTTADVGLAITEPAHTLFAHVLSTKTNIRVLERLGQLATRLRAGKKQQMEATYKKIIGPYASQMPASEDYVTALITTLLLQRMLYARLAKAKAWRPNMTVSGADAVSDALKLGKGVVFWTLPQEMTALLQRMACYDNSWNLYHLSHWAHGQSISKLGIATFNRRDCRTEDRLANRIWMNEKTTKQALAQATAILRGGGVVGIRGIGWSKRPVYFPLFDGHTKLAFGAPVLARRTGATLFTAATHYEAGQYRLEFEKLNTDPEKTEIDIGAEFVARLQAAALRSPQFWSASSRQWTYGDPPIPFAN